MIKNVKKQSRKTAPAISPDLKIADLLNAYPQVLDTLIDMGFEPLKNAAMRGIAAKLFTLEQAARIGGVDLSELLSAVSSAAGVSENRNTGVKAGPAESHHGPVPNLEGDATLLGLVPCPIRSVLVDLFRAFVQKLTTSSGDTVAWWLAGEGTGTDDVRDWLAALVENERFERMPDLFMGVGTEFFLFKQYGRSFYSNSIWESVQVTTTPRADLRNLEDPNGRLTLLFAVPFVLSCREKRLPGGSLPRRWTDLARPEFMGEIALPTLSLPAVPDLLGALHHHLGEDQFKSFAANVAAALHPAQASPRTGVGDVLGVSILPLHFVNMATATGGVQIIPEDGPVAVPAYLAARSGAGTAAASVAEHLMSREFLEPFWRLGGFLPNLADITTDMQFDKLITLPWEAALANDYDGVSERLIAAVDRGGES